jgi:predicted alpha/beta-fold hydrolase
MKFKAFHVPSFPPFFPRAPWWGGDLQTLRGLWPSRRAQRLLSCSDRVVLPLRDRSGDRLVAALNRPSAPERQRSLVLLIHGQCGSESSIYMMRAAAHFLSLGHPVLRLNLRGAGPSRAMCRWQYHAGRTGDLEDAIAGLPAEHLEAGLVAVGFSLGANLLLKFLGEHGASSPFRAAVAVSGPLNLAATARRLMRPRNAVYQRHLLRLGRRVSLGPGAEVTARERRAIMSAATVWDFDERFTAPRNGCAGAQEFYERNSSGQFLSRIAVPTLLIHSLDDPLIPAAPYLSFDWRSNPNLVPLISRRGGHLGFQGADVRTTWHDACAAKFFDTLIGDGAAGTERAQ